MSRRNFRRRSTASQMLGDAASIANRASWKGALVLGVISFVVLYWLVPSWLNGRMEAIQSKTLRPAIEALLGRRIHWFQYLGIALLLLCCLFSVRNYLRRGRLDTKGERSAGLVARLVARLLD